MFFGFLVHKISSTITVDPAESYTGEDVGAYDISGSGTIKGNTITRDGTGVFCQINVEGTGKDLTYPGPITNNGLSTKIQADINGDSVVMKYIVSNTGTDAKTFSLGSYYDLNYADTTDDSIVQAGSNIFYAVRGQDLKLFHILDSTDSYIGPDRYWYGVATSSDLSNYYYRDNSSGLATTGDLSIAFSFNNIEIDGGATKTLGIKFAFMSNIPDISFEDAGNDAYKEGETIYIQKVKVSNSNKGTVKFDFNGTTIYSYTYDRADVTKYPEFNQPSGLKFSPEKYCIQVYADAELRTPKRNYCFLYKNTPNISENIQATAVPGMRKVRISGTVTDKDEGKTLHLYAKVAGSNENPEIANFVSTGSSNPQAFQGDLDVSNQNGEISLKVWISSDQFSTESSEDTYYSKSDIRTVSFTVPEAVNPTLSVTFPDTTAFPRNKKITLNGNVRGNDLTMKFILDGEESETAKSVQNGEFSVDYDLPNTIQIGNHTLKVYVVDRSNARSEDSEIFNFTVQNSLPVITELSLERNSVQGGDQVTITGKIQDIDSGSNVIINAKHNSTILGNTTKISNGEPQPFTIQFITEDVMQDTHYQINIEASDGTGVFTSETNLQLIITVAKPKLTVEFPNPNKFPRNKKLHLTGTASGKGALTMKFIIDDHEMKKTQTVANEAFDFNLDLPNGIKIGPHKLIVYIVDEKQRQSDNSTVYSFNVENSHPIIEDLSVKKHKVESGEKVTITGKIQDIDAGSHVTITAKNGDKKLSQITVDSDGTMQPFAIEITAEEVTNETTFSITVEANDGTDTYTSDTKIILTVSSKQQNPQPHQQPDPNPEPTKTGDASTEAEIEKKRQKKTYIIIGVVVGLFVFIAIIAIIAFVVIKKKGSNTTMTEGGYQKDESFEP